MKKLSKSKQQDRRIADRIRSARNAAGLSQATLASLLGITPGAVAQWEGANGTKPRIERLESIASATRVSFEWLTTGHGDSHRRKAQADPTPLLTLDSFAQDINEELLLERFRQLSPQARAGLNAFLEKIVGRRK